MEKKYYTLLIIPQKEGSIRKFSLSTTLFRSVVLFVIICTGVMAYLSYEFVDNRSALDELTRLQQIEIIQKEQIELLAGKVSDFQRKMEDLRQFDKKLRIMTNLENNRDDGQFLGVGGPVPEAGSSGDAASEMEDALIEKIHESMDQLLEEASFQTESFNELKEFLEKQKSVLASTPSIWPVMGWVTSEYGYRVSPFTGKREFHRGIDIATRIGEDVVAPADGVLAKAAYESDMGHMVVIDHGNGITTCYGHLLKKCEIKRGRKVSRGDLIGVVGNSGRSTGPHLHYGVRVNNVYVNPRKYLF